MTKQHKTLDQRLAEIRLKKQQLAAREMKIQAEQKSRDLRRRARSEKVLLQLVLARVQDDTKFLSALLDQLEGSPLKPEDREAVLAIVTATVPKLAAAANAA